MNAEQLFLAAVAFFSTLLLLSNYYFIKRDAQIFSGTSFYIYLTIILAAFAAAVFFLRSRK